MKNTIQNLAKAFVGESQARNRYTIYAKIAKNEGYEQISDIFLQTAEQEREHANWLLKMINELKGDNQEFDEITIETGVPTLTKTTSENIKAAIGGENFEHTSMYPGFAQTAREEGLEAVANRLMSIAKAEAHHEERYKKLLNNLENNSVFKKDSTETWVCRKCGYEHSGTEAPHTCPSCGHPQSYFEVKSEKY